MCCLHNGQRVRGYSQSCPKKAIASLQACLISKATWVHQPAERQCQGRETVLTPWEVCNVQKTDHKHMTASLCNFDDPCERYDLAVMFIEGAVTCRCSMLGSACADMSCISVPPGRAPAHRSWLQLRTSLWITLFRVLAGNLLQRHAKIRPGQSHLDAVLEYPCFELMPSRVL